MITSKHKWNLLSIYLVLLLFLFIDSDEKILSVKSSKRLWPIYQNFILFEIQLIQSQHNEFYALPGVYTLLSLNI